MLQQKLQEAAIADQQKQQEQMRDEQIKIMTDVYAAVFERAIAYVNVITLAGYAGAFALLSATKDFLSPTVIVLTAFMLGFSLLIFCGWEIAKMILNGSYQLRFAELIQKPMSPESFFSRHQELVTSANKAQVKFNKWWAVIFILAIVPGFSAGGILLWHYILLLIA